MQNPQVQMQNPWESMCPSLCLTSVDVLHSRSTVVAVDSLDVIDRIPTTSLGGLTLYPPAGDALAIWELNPKCNDSGTGYASRVHLADQLESPGQVSGHT